MLPFILIFCGTLIAGSIGSFLTLWCAHVARTGCSPLPSVPKISLFKRKPADDEDDESTNGQHRPPARRVGP